MGWFSGVGCLARIVGPLYVTAVYKHFGMRWTATGIGCMLVLTLILIYVFWKRLVPYGYHRRSSDLAPTV